MANDVELVIGARNEAKAVLDDLGNSLRALAIPAQEGSLKAEAAVSGLLAKLATAVASMTGVFGAIAIGVGGLATASAVKSIKDEADALDALNRQLDNYVGKNRLSSESHRAFADEIKRSLGVSEEDTLQLMTKASALGVAEDKLDEAATAAIGLSKALGIDMQSALTKVINGDAELVSMLDSVNSGLNEQGAEVQGIAGLWNLLEVQTKKTLEFIAQATQPIQAALASLGTYIKDSVVNGIVGAVTAVEVFRERTAASLALVAVSWELITLQVVESTKHAFAVKMPAYVIWFVDNAFNLMSDGFNAILTAIQNFGAAASQALVALWEFIASGGAGGLEKLTNDMLLATGTLLEGFEATAGALPEVMKRKISEEEAGLISQMNSLGSSLGQTFNKKFQKNLQAMKVETPQLGALPDFKAAETDDGKAKGGANTDLNTSEARLLTRGKTDDIAKQQLELTKSVRDSLKVIEKNSNKTSGQPLRVVGGN